MSRIHRRLRLAHLAVATLLISLSSGCKKAERVDPTKETLADLSRRVDEYVALRDSLAKAVGEIDETKSQLEIATRATTLANAIIAARSQAKPGDIFTVEVASVIATLIRQEYGRRSDSVLENREDTQEELPNFVPQVNQIYPTTYPLATFPATLLPILPRLPEAVEYRIVTGYLILRDIEANLIVDLMPRAVPQE